MTQPMALRASAPAPVDQASGRAPPIVAIEVIRIGRRRCTEDWITASRVLRPRSRSWLANSTIRMPFLVMSPISRIMPIWL